MRQETLDSFRAIVYGQAGIALSPSKDALVHARLSKRLRTLGIPSYEDYLGYLGGEGGGEEIVHLLDEVCTNVTSFFREPAHFEFIASAIDQWSTQGVSRLRFWSAACSSGEEVYSLAMTAREAIGVRSSDLKILATDLSTTALAQCVEGSYEERRMEGVSGDLRRRYFRREQTDAGTRYRVRDMLREMVLVRRLNLSSPPFPMKSPIDIIMLRNVMIYFDDPVRRRLLGDVHRLLKPGGYLIVGHAESLTGMVSQFKNVAPGVYTRR
jgi:chemotaxis protein methyltransferase CheR